MPNLRTLAVTALAVALVSSPASVPSAAAQAPPSDCGWRTETSADTGNSLFIDESATYWSAAVAVENGGELELSGEFPHARYMSVAVYDQRLRTIDHATDVDIEPDEGSTNPFRRGAARTATDRSFTLRVVDARRPAGAAPPNVLYTESADGGRSSRGTGAIRVTLRIYAPDAGTDAMGGVDLPRITRLDATGRAAPLADCLAAQPSGGGPGIVIPGGRGTDPPHWDRFLPDGYGENIDAAYVFETFMPALGRVLTLRATAPTAPATRGGEPTMGEGDLRYWSMCADRLTTDVYGCLIDEDVPVAEDRAFTIVVSSAADRPDNARPECGVAWLEVPEGEEMLLVYRQMIPAGSFASAIHDVEPGREEQDLGRYYPRGVYGDAATFERSGCQLPASPSGSASSGSASGSASSGSASGSASSESGPQSAATTVAAVSVAAVGVAALVLGAVLRRRVRRRRDRSSPVPEEYP